MSEILDTILKFGADDDLLGAANFIHETSHHEPLVTFVQVTYQLLILKEYRLAFMLAKMIMANGINHPICCTALAVGGMMFGDAVEEERGRQGLQDVLDSMDEEQQGVFYNSLIKEIMPNLIGDPFFEKRYDLILRSLQILKAASPDMRKVFDFTAVSPPLDLAAMRKQGLERARLLHFKSPPPSAAYQNRRVIVAFRDLVFPQVPTSRPHEMGPRISACLNGYGWISEMLPVSTIEDGFNDILETCRRTKPDVLLVDEEILGIKYEYGRETRDKIYAILREELPHLKIVSVYLDAWMVAPEIFKAAVTQVDAIWTIWMGGPRNSLLEDPVFAGKHLAVCFPHAGYYRKHFKPLRPTMTFTGSVMGFNWHRVFWVTLIHSLGLPIETHLSNYLGDNLSALDSYAVYMKNLDESRCALNLTMRPDLSGYLTGRTFETLICGALLVQEATPDLDRYFIAGEHYLEFSTFAELCSIIRFIRDNPKEAEEIRQRGYMFAQTHYSDNKIAGYLDYILFHQNT